MKKHKGKRFLSLLLTAAMLLSLLSINASAVSGFAGGSGTEEDPYQISTQAQLAKATEAGKYYLLINDITATATSYICANFSGTFDGGGHTISGLKAPLFGTLPADTNPVIRNLNITYAGGSNARGVVFNSATNNTNSEGQVTLSNIHVTVTGTAIASGLAGEQNNRPITIENCSVIVKAGARISESGGAVIAGGLMRHVRAGTVLKNSFVYIEEGGSITATSSATANAIAAAGGLAGSLSHSSGGVTGSASITNCYLINKGTIGATVTGSDAIKVAGAGGIVGTNYGFSVTAAVSNTYVYNDGAITFTGAEDHVGILMGQKGAYSAAPKEITMSNLIAYTKNSVPMIGTVTSGSQAETDSTMVESADAMKNAGTYAGFDLNGAGSSWKQSASVSPVYNGLSELQGVPYLSMEDYCGPYADAKQTLVSAISETEGNYTVSYVLKNIRAVSGELTVTLPDGVTLMNGDVEVTGTDVTAVVTAEAGITVGSATLDGNTLTIIWGVATEVTPHYIDALSESRKILSFKVELTGAATVDAAASVCDNRGTGGPQIYTDSALSVFVGVNDNFAGGSGTEEDPYQIATQAQLAKATEAGKYYLLVNDITATGTTSLCTEFSGIFDGGGHTISGLKAPLFGTLPANTNPVIRNLTITYAGGSSARGTVFENAAGSGGQVTLSNIHVTVTGSAIGSGLAGEQNNRPITIENCSVIVKAGARISESGGGAVIAGGLMRHVRAGAVLKNSFVYIEEGGSITATSSATANAIAAAGGLAGSFSPHSSGGVTGSASITNCYLINKGTIGATVTGSDAIKVAGAGGIVGTNYGFSVTVAVSNTYVYNDGAITFTGAEDHVGILMGEMGNYQGVPKEITMSNLIAYTKNSVPMIGTVTSGSQATTGSTMVESADAMKNAGTYAGFDLNGAGSSWKQSASVSPVYNGLSELQGVPYLSMEFVAPSITTSMPDGAVGTAYSQTLEAIGTAPVTWSIESGSLPAGLSLSGNTISGTPTTAGTFTFTVKADNSLGSDTQELSITINNASSDFAGGSGTEEDPYQISTQAQLAKATEAGEYYLLINDITATATSYICANFSGTFDGGGHTISGLKAPLFGTLPADTNPVIRNLNITYAGGSNARGVVFSSAESNINSEGQVTLSNIHVTVTGTAIASGLAGETNKRPVTIENCRVVVSNGAQITESGGAAIAGGLVRHVRRGVTIKDSFVYIEEGGSITATSTSTAVAIAAAGGLAGSVSNSGNSAGNASITNCYLINKGTISATVKNSDALKVAGAGGIAGTNYITEVNPTISNTYVYNDGTITFTGAEGHAGILMGEMGNYKGVPKEITMSNLIAYTKNSVPMIGTVTSGSQAETGSTMVESADAMKNAGTYAGFELNGTGSSWKQSDSVSPVYNLLDLKGVPYLSMEADVKILTGIGVTTEPDKTTYTAGESFNSAGMVVTATYSNGSTAPVTDYTVTDGEALTVGKTSVTISYTESGVTKTATQAITVNEAVDPDIAIVEAALTAVNGASYGDVAQASYNTAEALNAYVKGLAEAAVTGTGVTVTVNSGDFTAAVAGDADDVDGTNGSYSFTITVSKGAQTKTTGSKSLTITATAYTGLSNADAVAAAKEAIVNGSVDVAYGADQSAKTAAVQSYVNGKLTGDATGVTAEVTYVSDNTYHVALSKGAANDSKDITMTINEAADPDIAIVNAALVAVNGASYGDVAQASRNTAEALNAYVKGLAEAAVGNNAVTVIVNNGSFTAAVAGDADDVDGTNGSYSFTITVSKGAQTKTTGSKSLTITATAYTGLSNADAVAAAKEAIEDGSVNVAYGADQAAKTSAVQSYVNGKLTGDAAGVTAVVSHKGGNTYTVSLSKGSASDSKDITMTINEAADPDIAIVEAALTAVNGASYGDVAQASYNTAEALNAYVKGLAEAAVTGTGVTVTVNSGDFTAAVAGDADDVDGTNGSYSFTITVSKGEQSQTTASKSVAITATAYTGVSNTAAVAAAKTAIVDGSVDVAFGADQNAKTAAVQSYVNGKLTGDATGVTAEVTYVSGNTYRVALSKGSARDSKDITMTINEAADPDIATVEAALNAVNGATYADVAQASYNTAEALNAYVKGLAETAVKNSAVTVTVTDGEFTAAVAGNAENTPGTNGSYSFTITVSKGAQSQTTASKSLTITATAYTGVSNTAAVAAAKTAIVDGSVDVAFGADQNAKTAAVQSYVNGKLTGDATGVTAEVTYVSGNTYRVALSKGSARDSKDITMTINEAAAAGVMVSGQVKSYNPGNATTVQLKQGDAVKYTTTIAATTGSGQVTQSFSIEGVAAGTYDLVVTKAGHLTYTITGVVVGDTALDLTANANAAISTITMLCGDMNGDGNINVTDLNTVWNAANYNKAVNAVDNALTDLNGDGNVNVSDLNILWNAANYNKNTGTHCTVAY